MAAIAAGIFFLAVSPSTVLEEITYFPILLRAHVDLGTRLAPFAQGHTLITGETGALPYYSNWVTYDFLGLGTNRLSPATLTVSELRAHSPRPDSSVRQFSGARGCRRDGQSGSIGGQPGLPALSQAVKPI
jgi:hypothetical protein